jgi:hypothetical protein
MADEAIETDVTDAAAPEAVQAQEAAPATQEAAKAETLLSASESDAEQPSKAEWPEDWRERLAGNDETLLKHLKRYSSPANYAKAGYEAQQKIRSGEVKKPLAADAKPEEVAAWRKENGLPETVEDMLKAVQPPQGMVFGEADKPVLESFAKVAHERNWSPSQMNDAVAWYAAEQERILSHRVEQDKAFQAQAQDELREEWGSAYRSEINGVKNFLDSNAPAEVREALLSGRGPDGNLLGNNPHVLKWLSSMSRELNPAASVVPVGTQNAGKSINDEISEIEGLMSNDPDKYWRDEKKQERYAQLVTAREKMNARAA